MFVAPSFTSRLAPFEEAEDNQTFYHSIITPLLRTEPEGRCASLYKHLTPHGVQSLQLSAQPSFYIAASDD